MEADVMFHENEITGYLSSCDIQKRGDSTVANIELRFNGAFNKHIEKYEPYYFPVESWLEEHIKKLKVANKNDLLTIRYRAVPRKLIVDGFQKKVIVWKLKDMKNWNESKVKKQNEEEPLQMSFDEKILEG